jgi:two-component system cell cycle response regulator
MGFKDKRNFPIECHMERNSLIIIDDDVTLLDVTKNWLSLKGYRCETSSCAASALELIHKTSFDIMIADIALPDMDGFKLIKKVRKLKSDMAIIVMTGFIDEFSYDDAIEAGASDFIKKPFTLKELIVRIEHSKLHERMNTMLLTDELTDLYNRRGFFTLGEYPLKIAKRQMKGIYMLYADLDDLKGINDTWGHQEGDVALKEVADILKNNYRESDIIARIGGDEFVVVPVGTAGDNADMIIGRLHKAVDIRNSKRNLNYQLSMSAGVAFYDPASPCSIDELLAQGDKSMYERKKCKRSRLLRLLS